MKATAVRFAEEGEKIFALDTNMRVLEEPCKLISDAGRFCAAHEANVTNTDEVQQLVETCIREFCRIDILQII